MGPKRADIIVVHAWHTGAQHVRDSLYGNVGRGGGGGGGGHLQMVVNGVA